MKFWFYYKDLRSGNLNLQGKNEVKILIKMLSKSKEGWEQSSTSLKNIGPVPQWCKLPQTSETFISWRVLAQGSAACLDPVKGFELYFCFAEGKWQSVVRSSMRTLSLWSTLLTPGIAVLMGSDCGVTAGAVARPSVRVAIPTPSCWKELSLTKLPCLKAGL